MMQSLFLTQINKNYITTNILAHAAHMFLTHNQN